MPHKADKSFFDKKRPWSERKDRILGTYLSAYLQKVARLGRPVAVVDAFAGPGKFKDGTPGSPLIICDAIRKARALNPALEAHALCIDVEKEFFATLVDVTSDFEFASCRCGTFLQHVDEIESLARSHTVFLYLDPWTVKGIEWNAIDRVIRHVRTTGKSIELLLNFNSPAFVRRGLAALSMEMPEPKPEQEDMEPDDLLTPTPASVERLNSIVGGDWWCKIVRGCSEFSEKTLAVAQGVTDRLRRQFAEVGMHAVKALPHHELSKYCLVFGTRHMDGLILMNDEFVKSTGTLAEQAEPAEPMLFEVRPTELVPDKSKIPGLVRDNLRQPRTRREVIENVIRIAFAQYLRKDIRGVIESMLKDKELQSETGSVRIKDTVRIWRVDT
ncbi:MAG: three-Cys-motif partner protein TcmP [bacterium]|nr:three-Cys-motif partner protein TcmP [bacterium]